MNDPMYGSTTNPQFAQGTPVYDVNGDKVGTLADTDPQTNGLVIQKGLFFPKDITIPMSTVARSDADGLYLSISKDDVSNGNWGTASTSGYGTSGYTGGTVDTTTPYAADAARSVGDSSLYSSQTAESSTIPGDRLATGREADISVPVHEEQLVADKQRGEMGQVRVHKDVVEEQQNVSIPVRHEEVRVESVPVEGRAASDIGQDAFSEKDINVPLMGEQVNVSKEARTTGEVRLRKQTVTEQQQVGDTVRKEQVRVDGVDDEAYQGGQGTFASTDEDTPPIVNR